MRVLERLRSHPEESEAVSAWATFIRSGLIPDRSRRPERPLDLEWEPSSEDAIVRAVGRKASLELEVANRIDADQSLILYCHASRDAKVIGSLVALAASAVEASTDQWRGDEAALLRARVVGLGAVEVCPWLSSTADLAEDVSSTSGLAVRKKLEGQFDRVRGLGYRAALVMDQRGAEDLTFGANFLPSPSTVLSVVEEIERQAAVAFDGLLLIGPQNGLQPSAGDRSAPSRR